MPTDHPSVNHFPQAPPEERATVEMVTADVQSFEGGLGPAVKASWEKRYRQYREFRRWTADRSSAAENDRDTWQADAGRKWGAQLHIPLSFRTIETMVPRAIAQAPRLLYLPRTPANEAGVDVVRLLVDSQQQQIDIDLPFQAVMRAGHIYGLGIGKGFWRQDFYNRSRMVPASFDPKQFVLEKVREKTFDDPDYEDVDPFDFMWDPMGSGLSGSGRCGWVVHRQWLGLKTCLSRLEEGVWDTASAQALAADPASEDKLRSMGSSAKYDEVWHFRMEALGYGAANFQGRGEQIHELWEWHDGERVVTILDRCLIVQDKESPCCGMYPFGVYRPTPLQKQMVGIGDLEPMEHLQSEMDTLRSQRRDASSIALNAGYAYDPSSVDAEDIAFGPGVLIPVLNAGNIDNALKPLQVRDIPGSSIEEERAIRADMESVVGLSDATDAGQTGAAMTATGAQLQQSVLGMRIMLKSRRFEIEIVRHAARVFLRMDQRMITGQRDPIRQPNPAYDQADPGDASRWQWFAVGPAELQGEWDIIPEGGSMAARNIPQDRQDAMQMMNLFGNDPNVDPRRVRMAALKLFGLDHAEAQAWLTRPETPIPPKALELLQGAGFNPDVINWAVTEAQRQDPLLAPPVDQQQGAVPNAA